MVRRTQEQERSVIGVSILPTQTGGQLRRTSPTLPPRSSLRPPRCGSRASQTASSPLTGAVSWQVPQLPLQRTSLRQVHSSLRNFLLLQRRKSLPHRSVSSATALLAGRRGRQVAADHGPSPQARTTALSIKAPPHHCGSRTPWSWLQRPSSRRQVPQCSPIPVQHTSPLLRRCRSLLPMQPASSSLPPPSATANSPTPRSVASLLALP